MAYKKDPNGPLISDKAIREEMDPTWEYRQAISAAQRQQETKEFARQAEIEERMKAAVRALVQVVEEHIDPLIDLPGAEYIKEAIRRKRKTFGQPDVRGVELLEPIKNLLQFHSYRCPCPWCGGMGCGDCTTQFAAGWVTHGMYAKMRRGRRHD